MHLLTIRFPLVLALALVAATASQAADPVGEATARGDADAALADYFADQTQRLAAACLAEVPSQEAWEERREEYRWQLLEMLGLDPLPERTPLEAQVTGTVERAAFTVENLHFQSLPGLYVTGNLYVPKGLEGPAPAILYVCGHGATRRDGVSYGSKVNYHHHGVWFAENGYVCLIIDTLQLGEIEGIHHGTYRYDMWWWKNRGYTPAGVEAWNSVRALDYLETRPEVDAQRMGVTGRSGGGAYSWWLAAIDDRVAAAAPVAGITDMTNHVVDGVVEGHCDCMFMVNTYEWDYPMVAALVAPRPLLIINTDNDRIFPLDGVVRTYEKVRPLYAAFGARDHLGLTIAPGPHRDLTPLREAAFRWFDQHLMDREQEVIAPAERRFEPEELKVFAELPADERNTSIHESFVPAAEPPEVPDSAATWEALRDGLREALSEKVFRGWPEEAEPPAVTLDHSTEEHGYLFRRFVFESQEHVPLAFFAITPLGGNAIERIVVHLLDAEAWDELAPLAETAFMAGDETAAEQLAPHQPEPGTAAVFFPPRGIGPTAWDEDPRKQVQIRRRFMLLGQTRDGMRVYDVCRAVEAIRRIEGLAEAPLALRARGPMAGVAVYAAIFGTGIEGLELAELPATHREGPFLLNVRRYLDMPQALALAAERAKVTLQAGEPQAWTWPAQLAERLGWEGDRLAFEALP